VLLQLLELILWALLGPRHDPPRTDTKVLGDINPPTPTRGTPGSAGTRERGGIVRAASQ
jgi:hypothetical protein